MTNLLPAYSGDNASNYEKIRSVSPRWKAEVAAMEQLLSHTKPSFVLDVPVGTGRWLDIFKKHKISCIGLDISGDMLQEAQARIQNYPEEIRGQFSLTQGSIFEPPSKINREKFDCIICIRFLNWISLKQANQAIEKLSTISTNSIIIGASVIPDDINPFKKTLFKIMLKIVNTKNHKRPRQYVHNEAGLINLFKSRGWTLTKRNFIFKNHSRENFFYLFER